MKHNQSAVTGEGNAPREWTTPTWKYWPNRFGSYDIGTGYMNIADASAKTEQAAKVIAESCNNYESVKAQRDELLAACKRLCDLCDRNEIEIPTHELTVIGQASAVIAKAEGNQ